MYLQSLDPADRPRLRVLAEQYAVACAEVNDRLSRCFSFLRQGLRAEAIHVADTPPAVMELLSILDFTKSAEWEERSEQHDWRRAPALAVDSAEALNEAYALENPLKEVIRTHRLLALGRAPLAERLATLRKLAELDSNNPNWQEDVRMIEKARLAQLDDAIKAHSQELDLPALTALEAELARQDWLEPPTEAQRATVKTAADELRRSAARSSLAEITQRLLDAYGLEDAEVAGRLRDRWQVREEAAIGRKDPLWVKTAPILEWLDQIDLADAGEASYQDLLRDIEDAIKQGGPRAELERLERIVSEMNRKLPPEVDSAIDDCYRRIDRRNRMLVIASASAVTVLALCCLALVFWFQVNGQPQARH